MTNFSKITRWLQLLSDKFMGLFLVIKTFFLQLAISITNVH